MHSDLSWPMDYYKSFIGMHPTIDFGKVDTQDSLGKSNTHDKVQGGHYLNSIIQKITLF